MYLSEIILKSTLDFLKAKEVVTRSLTPEHLTVLVPTLVLAGIREIVQLYFLGFMQLTLITKAEVVNVESLKLPLNKLTNAFILKCQRPSGRCKIAFLLSSVLK